MPGYYEKQVTPPIKIKVLDERCVPEQHGDWCDLKVYVFNSVGSNHMVHKINADGTRSAWRAEHGCERFEYMVGTVFKVSLGVAMQIPEGYHAQVVPRSSTRKHYGVMLTNSIGIIDNSYNGDGDIWMAEFYALQDGSMKIGDRVLQFRLVKNGDPIEFEYVDHLDNADRGGFGSTGRA